MIVQIDQAIQAFRRAGVALAQHLGEPEWR